MAKTWVIVLLAAALWTGYLLGFSTRRSETIAAANVVQPSAAAAGQDSPAATEPLESRATFDGQLVEGPGQVAVARVRV